MGGTVLSVASGYFLSVNNGEEVELVIPGEEVPCLAESRQLGSRNVSEARSISILRHRFGRYGNHLKVGGILLPESRVFSGVLKVSLKNDGVLVFEFSTELDGIPCVYSFEDLKVPMRLGTLSRGQNAFGERLN